MEDLPEELRTPPVSLVSLVGLSEFHPTISSFLHSKQPPINSLGLADFSNVSFVARKLKDPLSSATAPPAGFLKRDWLSKRRTRVPSVVAALFSADQVSGDPTQWLKVCTDLETLKSVISGRNIKLVVVVVQPTVSDDVSEDQITALRKRAEIDPKCLMLLVQNGPAELKQSLVRLGNLFAELAIAYYREEGRRIKIRIEKKNFNFAESHVRYCFKAAVYAEFRRDWAEALRFYEDAYFALHEMIGTSTRLPPIQRLIEIKAVAEQLHFKVSTLLLHGGKVVEAITWFWRHIACYEKLTGVPEAAFLHWDWMSKQYLVVAELLETSSVAIPTAVPLPLSTSERPITEWEFQPAHYYQLAASCLREKRGAFEVSQSVLQNPEYHAEVLAVENSADSVVPSLYVGQSTWLVENGEAYATRPLTDLEYLAYAVSEGKRYQDSYEIVALLTKSCGLYSNLKAQRMASYSSHQMAREHFVVGDLGKAKDLFDGIAGLYRQEGWQTLLWEILGYLRDCSRKLGLLKDYVEYSLEMASLPITSGNHPDSLGLKDQYGPAGPPSLSMKETVHEEISSILKGEPTLKLSGDQSWISLTEDQPLHLEIDLVSPLRTVFLASVAFHDQSVKPGTPTFLTLSLISCLPHPFDVEQLEIQFNQPACNFVKNLEKQSIATQGQELRVENVPSMTLVPYKWVRLTYDIIPAQSGKLECVSVLARISKYFTICFRAESPASMEGQPLWKFEDRIEVLPTKDPTLSSIGQKVIQVEDPDPLVDLVLSSAGPALVGEIYPVSVLVITKGHRVCSGELKINLVDPRGALITPRDVESFSSENHDVELIGISVSSELKEPLPNSEVTENKSPNVENVRKVQQSFGLLSVPFLDVGESWSCRLDIKWHRPKSVTLYVSLGYSPNSWESTAQKVNVHKSLQIEGSVAIAISHQFIMPFRKDLLLLSRIRQDTSSSGHLTTLALNEKNILLVTAKSCSEVPLQLTSASLQMDDKDGETCILGHACSPDHVLVSNCSDPMSSELVLMPGEEFKWIFSVCPLKEVMGMPMGTLSIGWRRKSQSMESESCSAMEIVSKQKLPYVNVEKAVVVVHLDCPPYAILGVPFSFSLRIENQTALVQEIQYSLLETPSFLISGSHSDAVFVLPNSEQVLAYTLLPLFSGHQQLPQIIVTSERYSARLQTSASSARLFVFPSNPQFQLGSVSKKGNASES
ncbi:Trafficking protein particle complex subunit 11 [Nymphaea thermarum]|nr:Trafficking protein particle complex subunit 11 [Nymphaea thermarum]